MLLLLKRNINMITVACHDCSLSLSLSIRLILPLCHLAVIKKVNKLLAASLRVTNPFFVISVHGVAKRLEVSSRLRRCHRKRKKKKLFFALFVKLFTAGECGAS